MIAKLPCRGPRTRRQPSLPWTSARPALVAGLCALAAACTVPLAHAAELPLANWQDAVTRDDAGFDSFSGNAGLVAPPGVRASLTVRAPTRAAANQVLTWDFSADRSGFAGAFFCLAVCETKVLLGAGNTEAAATDVSFPEHALNLNRIDSPLRTTPRRIDALKLTLEYQGTQPLTLRIELKDVRCLRQSPATASACGGRYKRFTISNTTKALLWDFRHSYQPFSSGDLDLARAKSVVLVVEGRNDAAHVKNPLRGSLSLRNLAFTSSDVVAAPPQSDQALRDEIELRAFQYFVDNLCRKSACYGLPQDRSTFPDLLTIGGVGFSLPALTIGVARGWITRELAVSITLHVLRQLANPAAFGPQRAGRIGYRGFFFHFLSLDGRRKRNFNFAATAGDESQNTVELSTIDTALALMGVLTAQSFFDRPLSTEREIRTLAQRIYDRVEWPFMLDAATKQWILGWKPIETHSAEPQFEKIDAAKLGHYASKNHGNAAATLDYYTDEALIITLLAAGSRTHPLSVPKNIYCALLRPQDNGGLVRTFPGALFTFTFLATFIETQNLAFTACPGEPRPTDWFANSRLAIAAAARWARANPDNYPSYGALAFFIDAMEGPSGEYAARGAKPLRTDCIANADCEPTEDGAIAYYSAGEILNLHRARQPLRLSRGVSLDLLSTATQALRRAWQRGHFHGRTGIADGYTDDIAHAVAIDPTAGGRHWVRTSGAWVQRVNFAIDNGPLLLGLENQRSQLVHKLLAKNSNVRRAIARLQ